MSEKRRDHRGRILHNGEIQLSDGRYRFKYVDEMGKERCVYSWRLDHNDATPKGKRRTLSLRENGEENSGGPFRADCNKWRKHDSAGTG